MQPCFPGSLSGWAQQACVAASVTHGSVTTGATEQVPSVLEGNEAESWGNVPRVTQPISGDTGMRTASRSLEFQPRALPRTLLLSKGGIAHPAQGVGVNAVGGAFES